MPKAPSPSAATKASRRREGKSRAVTRTVSATRHACPQKSGWCCLPASSHLILTKALDAILQMKKLRFGDGLPRTTQPQGDKRAWGGPGHLLQNSAATSISCPAGTGESGRGRTGRHPHIS